LLVFIAIQKRWLAQTVPTNRPIVTYLMFIIHIADLSDHVNSLSGIHQAKRLHQDRESIHNSDYLDYYNAISQDIH